MKQYRITLEDRSFDVKVLDDPRRERVRVEVDGETFVVGVEAVSATAEVIAREAVPTAAASRPTQAPETVAVSGNVVAAPLPGVIKSIVVRPNQQVALNDELLVIEAMKMDNVIRATRAGTVGTIYVTEGRQVAYGETLLDLD
jgi:biotin carboxyl carrier protein